MDKWKKQSAFRSIFKKVPKTKMISKMKLSLFETVYARRVVIFPLKFYCELSTTLRRHHTPMTTASTYSSGMRNTRRPRRGLGNWAAPATDQNQCRRTYKKSVISGSHSRRKRKAHYYPAQHLMQRITNQRLYRDNMPTSPKRLTYLETYCYIVNDISTLLNTTLLFHLEKNSS